MKRFLPTVLVWLFTIITSISAIERGDIPPSPIKNTVARYHVDKWDYPFIPIVGRGLNVIYWEDKPIKEEVSTTITIGHTLSRKKRFNISLTVFFPQGQKTPFDLSLLSIVTYLENRYGGSSLSTERGSVDVIEGKSHFLEHHMVKFSPLVQQENFFEDLYLYLNFSPEVRNASQNILKQEN